MRFEIIGKNVTITPAMREKIEKKFSVLNKYLLIQEDTIARVLVRIYPNSQKVEVTIPTRVGLLRTEVEQDEFYAAIDVAVDKLEDQLRRQKTRLKKHHHESLAQAFIEEKEVNEQQEEVKVKTKQISIDEMDLDEAIMQMELTDHNFYVYMDDETKKVAVVYRRHKGGYGLLELDY